MTGFSVSPSRPSKSEGSMVESASEAWVDDILDVIKRRSVVLDEKYIV